MIRLENIRFEYGHTPIIDSISFSIGPGDRIGLIGPNGAGKSTLLRLLVGEIQPTDGVIDRTRDIVGFMPQELSMWHELTAQECIEQLTGVAQAYRDLDAATENMAEDDTAYNEALERLESLGAYSQEERLPRALREVGLAPNLLERKVGELSGGQQTKLALAAVLVAQYDVFLLDEPTNNLDLAGIDILEKFIRESKAGFLIISHDRRFLKDTMNKMVILKPQAGGMDFFGGGFADWRLHEERGRAAQERAYAVQQNQLNSLEDARANAMSQSVKTDRADKGRRDNEKMGSDRKNENAGKTLARQSKAIEARLDKIVEIERPDEVMDLKVLFPITKNRPGGDMATLEGAVIDYGQREMGPYDLRIGGDDRIAVVGPNGEGKSTLVHILIGELELKKGTREVAESTKIGFIAQQPEFADPEDTLVDNVARLAKVDQTKASTELARFGIPREAQLVKAARVSPGQRGKAFLAVHALRATNLLILDEPTNHLEVAASEALGKALATYPGTLLVVSHDREFLREININRYIVVENGRVLDEKASRKYAIQHHLIEDPENN